MCKNTPKLTSLLQNSRSRISPLLNLEKQGDRKRDRKRTATKRKKVDKEERKTARLFAPTCLDLKEEREKRQRITDAWEAMKGGTKMREEERKRRRGRGRDMCAAPKGTLTFEAEALEQAVASTS